MSIIPINETMDVIDHNVTVDIDTLSLNDLINHIELENELYYFNRLKRTRRRNRAKNTNILVKLHRALTIANKQNRTVTA